MPDMDKLLQAEISAAKESEWRGTIGGENVVLRATPICPAEVTIVERKHPNFTTSPTQGGMVAMIVLKARDENGAKAFQKKHEELLNRLPSVMIGDIFGGLFGDQFTDIDDPDGEKHEVRVGN